MFLGEGNIVCICLLINQHTQISYVLYNPVAGKLWKNWAGKKNILVVVVILEANGNFILFLCSGREGGGGDLPSQVIMKVLYRLMLSPENNSTKTNVETTATTTVTHGKKPIKYRNSVTHYLWTRVSLWCYDELSMYCNPCFSDTTTHTYRPLDFPTHVHSGHCNTASHTIMKVDRLFVHTKTAYIIPKKMDERCIHPAFVTYWKTQVSCSLFCDILCK